MELFIMLFSSLFYYFLSLMPNSSAHHPVLEHRKCVLLPKSEGQSFKLGINKEVNVAAFIFAFLDVGRKDQIFRAEWFQAFPEFNVLKFLLNVILIFSISSYCI
jgi:hypothetical protein